MPARAENLYTDIPERGTDSNDKNNGNSEKIYIAVYSHA